MVRTKRSDFGLEQILNVISAQIILIAGLFLFYWMLQTIQEKWFPVVSDFTIVSASIDENGWLVFTPAIKKERSCKWVGMSWWVVDGNGRALQVAIDYPEMPAGDQSAPQGYSIQDVHRVNQKALSGAVAQFGVLKHNCLGVFTIEKLIGPMPIFRPAMLRDDGFLSRINDHFLKSKRKAGLPDPALDAIEEIF